MNCYDAHPWLNALLDNELDRDEAAELRAHLAQCPACMNRYRSLEALRAGLHRAGMRYEVPLSLRRNVEAIAYAASSGTPLHSAAADSTPGSNTSGAETSAASDVAPLIASPEHAAPPRSHGTRKWLAGRPLASIGRGLLWAGWPVAIAASVLLALNLGDRREDFLNEVVAAHVRSTLVNHLSDVASSDHHTVKPWFAGKLDFSPPVPDLSAQGFPLIGGRLEYLDHQLAAAIVYRHNAHVINLLVRSANASTPRLQHAYVHNGYALREWRAAGLDFIAVSDVEPAELERFERAYRSEQTPK